MWEISRRPIESRCGVGLSSLPQDLLQGCEDDEEEEGGASETKSGATMIMRELWTPELTRAVHSGKYLCVSMKYENGAMKDEIRQVG